MTTEYPQIRVLKNTTNLLLRLGFQAHQRGYRYLREAVCIVFQEPESLASVTKYIYPEVAKRFNTTDKQVERAIRNSIETAWSNGNAKGFEDVLGEMYISSESRPTNKEIIEMLKSHIEHYPMPE